MTATLPDGPSVEVPEPLVLTAAEYDALPHSGRVELVDGVVRAMTPATRRHQIVVQRIREALEGVCPDDHRVVWEQVAHTFRLGVSGAYLESGMFKAADRVAAPGLMWASIGVSELAP